MDPKTYDEQMEAAIAGRSELARLREQNAELLAALSEMLAAAEGRLPREMNALAIYGRARAAIAKAEGRS